MTEHCTLSSRQATTSGQSQPRHWSGRQRIQFAALWDDDHFPGLPYHGSEAIKGQNSGIFNIHANCSNEVGHLLLSPGLTPCGCKLSVSAA